MRYLLLCLIIIFTAVTVGHSEQQSLLFPFVLPWDDASPGIINLSDWLERPASKNGFVTARSSHLYMGSKRIRLFGVNF